MWGVDIHGVRVCNMRMCGKDCSLDEHSIMSLISDILDAVAPSAT